MGTRAIVGAAAAIGLAIGCSRATFVCASDDDCVDSGTPGVCEAAGACSFADDDCASGRRYGELSDEPLAGACVDENASGSTDGSTHSPGTQDDGSLDSLTTTAPIEGTASTATSDDDGDSSDDGTSDCVASWWDCRWSRRVPLRIAGVAAEPMLDVPVMVLLDTTRIDAAMVSAAGEDLRFVDDAGSLLPHEIEHWDPAGVSVLWIAVPSLAADTELWLYHGNPNAADVQNLDAVWADPFVGVWHLDASTDDSSGAGNHGVTSGGVTPASGWAAGAREFFAVDDRIDVPAATSLENLFITGGTVSAWARPDTFGGTERGRIADNTADGDGGWMFYVASDGGGSLRWRYGYEGGQSIWAGPDAAITTDRWYHLAITFATDTGELPRMYIDGVEVMSSVPDEIPMTPAVGDVGNDLVIGNSNVENRWFDGRIDELRLERGMRGPTWIATQVQSMRDELVEYGGIERLEDLR